MAPSEFVIIKFHRTKDIFSAAAHLYRCIMAKLRVTEHSGFRKDFGSFTVKDIYRFDVSSIDTDLFLFKHAIWKLLSVKSSKTQKQLVQMCFLTT